MKLVDNFLKSFIFSYYLPSSIFVISNYFLIVLLVKEGDVSGTVDAIGEAVHLDRILLIILISGFVSYVFRSSDYQLIRLFEGYTFRRLLGLLTWRKKRKKRKLHKKTNELRNDFWRSWNKALRAALEEITGQDAAEKREEVEQQAENNRKLFYDMYSSNLLQLSQKLEAEYPHSLDHILPTKVGNIFRAFEEYPQRKYGIQTIVIWPKLLLVLPESDKKHLEEAQGAMMFFLTSSFLSFLLFVESAIASGWMHHFKQGVTVPCVMSAVCLLLSIFFYHNSIDSVLGFGEVVKATFDLRRKHLLESLGLPFNETLQNERKRWEWLSRYYLYRDWGTENQPDLVPAELAGEETPFDLNR